MGDGNMPLYDYSCEHCGPFEAWQSMSECRAPFDCPTCGDLGARVVTAPFIADMNPNSRVAHQRNEKSADEPQMMSRGELNGLGSKRSKAPGHGGHGGHGGHRHHSGRPWVIGH